MRPRILSFFLSTLLCLYVIGCRFNPLDSTNNQCSLDRKQHLPNVVVIGTGGTISGRGNSPADTTHYTAGAIEIDRLLDEIRPSFEEDVNVISYQLFQLDSIDIDSPQIIALHHEIDIYNSCPDIYGVVVLAGSSAVLPVSTVLEHIVKPNKPVILVVSFKPFTAYGSEAKGNLLASIYTVATIEINRVLILSNDVLFLPYETRKENNRFVPGPDSYVGDIVNCRPRMRHSWHYIPKTFDISKIKPEQEFSIVEGFTSYIGFGGEMFRRSHAKAIVINTMDNGWLPSEPRMVLEELDVLVVATTSPTFLGVCGRIRGAVCANHWSFESTIPLVKLLLASPLSMQEIDRFIERPLEVTGA